jgi:prepilin peptidase CpaA
MLTAAAIGLYVVALIAAGASDLTRYEIPNGLSAALIGAFALLLPSLPLTVLAEHLSAGLAVLVGAFLLFAVGLWGGGDAKLVAAASVWIGWRELAAFLLLTALLGAILALALLLARRLLAGRAGQHRWYSRLLSPSEGVPYGVAIAAAALALTPRLGVVDMASLG